MTVYLYYHQRIRLTVSAVSSPFYINECTKDFIVKTLRKEITVAYTLGHLNQIEYAKLRSQMEYEFN